MAHMADVVGQHPASVNLFPSTLHPQNPSDVHLP